MRCVHDADAIAAAAARTVTAAADAADSAAIAEAETHEEAESPTADGATTPEEGEQEEGGGDAAGTLSMLDSDSWSEDTVASQPQLSKALFLTQRLLRFFKVHKDRCSCCFLK